AGKQVNCIMIWLDGGPSHYETFDPKPDAPSEIRGEFKAIPTSAPGIQFCEAVPNLAKTAAKLTIVRSICHKDPNHGGGNHYMMTGSPTPVPVACGAFVRVHPSFGWVLPREISEGRAASRRELRVSLDRLKRYTDKLADDPAVTFDQYYQQGVELVLSPQAQAAFDIQREDEQVREAYGRNDFGQRLLL